MRIWLLLLLIKACAHMPSAKVEHYTGELTLSIPRTKTPFARLPIVVRITRDPEAGLIMEEMVLPGLTAKAPAREIVTNFTATAKAGVYAVQDNLKSFHGLVEFRGTPWAWEDWRIDAQLKSGPRIIGNAHQEDGKINAVKTIYHAKGKPLFIQREQLRQVSATEYKLRRRQIVKQELPILLKNP